MIAATSLWGIVLRYARLWKRDLNLILGSFYWPLLDIIMWGFLGAWIQQSQTTTVYNYQTITLLGILLWQIVGRGCNIMAFSLNEELWSTNIVNLFSLPLRITEWIGGILLLSAFIMVLTSCFSFIAIYLLYDVSLWYVFTTFILFVPPLFLSSVWVGFTSLQVVILLGKRGIEIGFIIGWFLFPFSGAFYPIETLPNWGQTISSFLPMSYIFKGMREYVMHQHNPTSYLITGYLLASIYAITAVALFIYCFNRSKHKGLARLTD